MAGDGISVPTTLSQMGTVAKAQASQSAQNVNPFGEQHDKRDDLKVQKVKETEKAQQEKVDPDKERPDKRKRRRLRRTSKVPGREDEAAAGDREDPPDEEQQEEETLGAMIDLRV